MSHVQYYDFLVYLWGGDLIQIKIHSWEARRQKSSENRAKSADAENRNKNFMTQQKCQNNRKRNCNNSFGSKSLID